jgi:hypothetical protein
MRYGKEALIAPLAVSRVTKLPPEQLKPSKGRYDGISKIKQAVFWAQSSSPR